jgi:F-actin-capping protein subunit beta
MIENLEMKLRTTLNTIYFGKTKDIANELRQINGVALLKHQREVASQIGVGMASR